MPPFTPSRPITYSAIGLTHLHYCLGLPVTAASQDHVGQYLEHGAQLRAALAAKCHENIPL